MKNEISVSVLAMFYYIFFSINMLTYLSLTNVQMFLAVVLRLSHVFEMEQHIQKRVANVDASEVGISFKQASFAWGFRVKENQ